MQDQVTVALLSYRRPESLKACLTSLFAHTPSVRVEILNQGYLNAPLRRLYASLANRSTVHVTYGGRNLGCSAGRKFLADGLTTPFVFYADDDVVFTSKWLEPLLEAMQACPQAGAISPVLFSRRWGCLLAGTMTVINRNLQLTGLSSEAISTEEPLVWCDYLPGGAVLLRRELLAEVTHDPHYFIGWEDVDFFLQMRQTRWKAGLCPHSQVMEGPLPRLDFNRLAYQKTRWNSRVIAESRRYLMEKWDLVGFESLDATPSFGSRHPWLRRFGRPLRTWGRRTVKAIAPWLPWE